MSSQTREPGRREDDPGGLWGRYASRRVRDVAMVLVLLSGAGAGGTGVYQYMRPVPPVPAPVPAYTRSEVDGQLALVRAEIASVRAEVASNERLTTSQLVPLLKRVERIDEKLERWFERAGRR